MGVGSKAPFSCYRNRRRGCSPHRMVSGKASPFLSIDISILCVKDNNVQQYTQWWEGSSQLSGWSLLPCMVPWSSSGPFKEGMKGRGSELAHHCPHSVLVQAVVWAGSLHSLVPRTVGLLEEGMGGQGSEADDLFLSCFQQVGSW